MVQNPKGGGLSSSLGGSQMMGGVQKTTDFLDKSTWILAMILTALVLLSCLSFTDTLGDSDSKIIDTTQKASPAAATPAAPAAPAKAVPTPAVPATK
jgi:preprotein translocase subunit SecG